MASADRISSLPDDVLCHVLSFLPTKLAIATSVLSKRWRPLWRSLPSVDFDDESYQNDDKQLLFVRFVYAVMLSRDVQSIKRFRLRCWSFCDSSTINKWVNFATQRNVEQLELSLPSSKGMNLPHSILGCQTLVVLKLMGITINALSSVHFPSLKTLQLLSVQFPDFDCIRNLLCGCPNLEDLRERRSLISKSFPMGKFQTLPKLVKADIQSWDLIHNVVPLRIHTLGADVWSFAVPIFPNLAQLELNVSFVDWCVIAKFLLNTPNLQMLGIYRIASLYFNFQEQWEGPKLVPECLSSRLRTCRFEGYIGLLDEQFVSYIMQKAKVLRTVTISPSTFYTTEGKLQLLKRLSCCPRISTCKLVFEL